MICITLDSGISCVPSIFCWDLGGAEIAATKIEYVPKVSHNTFEISGYLLYYHIVHRSTVPHKYHTNQLYLLISWPLDRALQRMAFIGRISVVVNHFSPNMQVIRVWGKFVESDET